MWPKQISMPKQTDSKFSSGMKQREARAAFYPGWFSLLETHDLGPGSYRTVSEQLKNLPPLYNFIASNQQSEYPSNAHLINILNYK
jgi:hypothetical protein